MDDLVVCDGYCESGAKATHPDPEFGGDRKCLCKNCHIDKIHELISGLESDIESYREQLKTLGVKNCG